MKKIITLLLVFLLVGCSSNKKTKLDELLENGYYISSSEREENAFKCLLRQEESFENMYTVKATLTDSEVEKIEALDFFDDNYSKQLAKILNANDSLLVEESSFKVPTDSELEKYIGKTFGELEDMGYENTGYSGDDGDYRFFYDGPEYAVVLIALEEIKSIDDLSTNDIKTLTVKAIEFSGLSQYYSY